MTTSKQFQEALSRPESSHLAGPWVAILGSDIIASGPRLKGVYEQIKKTQNPVKVLFAKIPGNEALIL